MSLQIRRGPNSGAGGRTGVTLVQGEIAFVTDYASANVSPMWIGDGVTLGGIPVSPVLNVNGLTGNVALTTNTIGEGSLNKYFTDTRASDAVGAMLAAGTKTGLTITYNNTTHAITITNTNVIQTGTAKSVAYWAANGTTLSPTQSLTWDETANNLQLNSSTLFVTANNGPRPTVVFDNYNSGATSANSLALRKARGTDVTPLAVQAADQIHQIAFQGYDGSGFSNTSLIQGIVHYTGTPTVGNVQGALQFYTTDSAGTSAILYPRVRLDNTGLMCVGPFATNESGTGQIIVRQQISSNGKTPLSVYNMYNDAYPASISIIKSRGSFAAPIAVGINDALAAVNFRGYHGSGYATAANIIVNADLAPGTGFIPGSMSFQVTNASGILTEALKISNDGSTNATGNFTINGSLTVNGSTVTTNTTTINVEDKLMKLGYLTNGAVSDTGAVGSITGSLLQSSTTFTSNGVSVTAAATYTAVSQSATSGTGNGAVFTIQKTGAVASYISYVSLASGTVGAIKGALLQASTTFSITGTSVTAASTYTGVSQSATSGTGTGAVFTIQKIGAGTAYNGAIVITITTPGTGYAIGNTITIPGASLGGATPANNLVLTVGTALGGPWTANITGLSDTVDLQIGSAITATGAGTTGTVTATATTRAIASCTAGSASGTVLTIGGTVSGVFAVGMMLSGAGIGAGIYIVSGSGTTWNLSVSTIIGSTAITGTSNLITVNSTSSLQNNTIVTPSSTFGGLVASTGYYVNFIASATQFSVGATATTTNDVTLTNASGSVSLIYSNGSLGAGGSYLVSNITSATSITYVATGGTTPVAGPITDVSTNGATDYTANGGGIQVYGATNKTFTWSSTSNAWTSSENVVLASGKKLSLNGSVSGAVSFTATGVVGTQNYVLPTALPASSGYALASDTSGNLSWIAVNSSTISGAQLTNGATVSGGSLTFSGNISAAAWTTSGIRHVSVPATLTDTTSTGVVTNAYTNNFGGNTIAATGTVTYTNYGTVFINNPSSGANVTITNPWSLITAGNVLLGGDLVGVATQNVFNTISTTVNAFGGATSALKIGASTAPITGFAATATTSSTAASLGYVGMPQNTQSSAYPIVIGDAGKHIYASATMTATIPANGSVAFPIGTTIAFIAAAGATLTIAITTDTMYLGGTGTTGSRTLAPYGMATAVKVTATSWFINGTGLT